jgi:FkbM family methyltransferase
MSLYHSLRFVWCHPLNRRARLRALGRLVRWQIGSRLVPGRVLCPWVGGTRLLVGPGETGLTGNVYAGLHEFPEMGYVLHCLRPGDLFADVGANAGAYTVLAGGVVGASGGSFEPVPATFSRLVENVRFNGLDGRVRCRPLALGAAPGRVAFTCNQDTVNHALGPGESAATIEVEVSTLDLELGRETPALIKIDVEGYEAEVLKGAQGTLRRPGLHSLILELNGSGARYGVDEVAIAAELAQLGFRPFAYDPLSRDLRPLAAAGSVGNTLFIRDEVLVRQRLREAPRVLVNGVGF